MRTAVVLVTVLALAPACRNDCRPGAAPRLEVGTGELLYSSLDPDKPEWDLVHGPQGGWHVLVGLDAAGFPLNEVVVAKMFGRVDGEVVAGNDSAWLSFECNEDTRTLQTVNTFLIFAPGEDHCSLHEQTLEVEVEAESAGGETIVATTTGEIVDPEAATCE